MPHYMHHQAGMVDGSFEAHQADMRRTQALDAAATAAAAAAQQQQKQKQTGWAQCYEAAAHDPYLTAFLVSEQR